MATKNLKKGLPSYSNIMTTRTFLHYQLNNDNGLRRPRTIQDFIYQLRHNLFPRTILRSSNHDKRRIHTTIAATTKAIENIPKETKPPVLLLTGNEYQLSKDGSSRSLYKFPSSDFCIEELYYLNNAMKKFWIRSSLNETEKEQIIEFSSTSKSKHYVYPIELQEIKYHQDHLRDNTGSMTWESSILMAFHLSSTVFSHQMDINLGHVLELGSGVGLGGILTKKLLPNATIKSLTLTDHNSSILQKCQENILTDNTKYSNNGRNITNKHGMIEVSYLDWNNIQSSLCSSKKFDTILASDVVYSKESIDPLSKTIKYLLNKNGGVAHLFGPNNRSSLHDLINHLQSDTSMTVNVEPLEMERFRILPTSSINQKQYKHRYCYSTKQVANFLHITVKYSQNTQLTAQKLPTKTKLMSMSDID